MHIKIESVRNPIWTDKERTAINCMVRINHVKGEILFTASQYDSEEHGRKLFSELISGKYGKIKNVLKLKKITILE